MSSFTSQVSTATRCEDHIRGSAAFWFPLGGPVGAVGAYGYPATQKRGVGNRREL
jgi:hypothetical protein